MTLGENSNSHPSSMVLKLAFFCIFIDEKGYEDIYISHENIFLKQLNLLFGTLIFWPNFLQVHMDGRD